MERLLLRLPLISEQFHFFFDRNILIESLNERLFIECCFFQNPGAGHVQAEPWNGTEEVLY